MLETALSLVEDALPATSAAAASAAFARATKRHGASYVQTRLYRRPRATLTSATHWQAGGVLVRDAVPGWEGSAGFDFICFEKNPLLEPIRRGLTRYRFSDFAAHDDREYADYWDALSEARIGDAVCATAYGDGGRIASLHVGLPDRDVPPATAASFGMAGSILVELLMGFDCPASPEGGSRLSPRERDALAFVAEGKTDWEIATILGVAESTARFHVDNARRKLGAVNRAHAVARFMVEYGPI